MVVPPPWIEVPSGTGGIVRWGRPAISRCAARPSPRGCPPPVPLAPPHHIIRRTQVVAFKSWMVVVGWKVGRSEHRKGSDTLGLCTVQPAWGCMGCMVGHQVHVGGSSIRHQVGQLLLSDHERGSQLPHSPDTAKMLL